MKRSKSVQEIERNIHRGIRRYFKEIPLDAIKPSKWRVPIGGGNYNERETIAVLNCLLNGLLSTQKPVVEFEKKFSKYIGCKYGVAVNSGTSANILALNALLEAGDLEKGDEIAMPAATYISVASPVIQLGLKPVYFDVELETLNLDPAQLELALKRRNRIKCLMIVHTLGYPADMEQLMRIAKQYKLKVIEDCCEAHGVEYKGKKVGSFGDIATWSFYVAHHMTTADGGMVATSSKKYHDIIIELREFGRDYSYQGKRYGYTKGKLKDFDERYAFRRIGWNFRISDVPAAFGIEQLKKLDAMNAKRVKNAKYLLKKLKKHSSFFILPSFEDTEVSPVHYTFPITIKRSAPFSRKELAIHLESHGVETRAIMCGTLPDQPSLVHAPGRSVGNLKNSRLVKDNAFFVGCHPMLAEKELDYVAHVIENFLKTHAS